MAQWLSALVALAEDPDSVPSTHMGDHNHPQLQFQGYLKNMPMVHKHTHRQNTNTHKDKINA